MVVGSVPFSWAAKSKVSSFVPFGSLHVSVLFIVHGLPKTKSVRYPFAWADRAWLESHAKLKPVPFLRGDLVPPGDLHGNPFSLLWRLDKWNWGPNPRPSYWTKSCTTLKPWLNHVEPMVS